MHLASSLTPRRLALLAAVPLMLAMGACGDDDTGGTDGANDSADSSSSAPQVDGTGSDANGAGGAEGTDDEVIETVAATAAGAVDGGIAFAVEREDDGWDVEVVGPTGRRSDVVVSADGAEVVSGPTAESTSTDDLAENNRLREAGAIDLAEALAAARAEVPTGPIDSIELDELDRALWEVEFDFTATARALKLDAVTGEVVEVETRD